MQSTQGKLKNQEEQLENYILLHFGGTLEKV